MKHYLLAAAGLTAAPALAQTPPPAGQEVAAPFAGATGVVLHTAGSARAACANVARALRAAGYTLNRPDKKTLNLSTQPNYVDGRMQLLLQVEALPEASGSSLTFRGIFSVRAAPDRLAQVVHRHLPVHYSDAADSLTQQAWNELQRVALAALPGARVGYQ